MEKDVSAAGKTAMSSKKITLFLAGNVMTGRGIDQVLAHPSNPIIIEPFILGNNIYIQSLVQGWNGFFLSRQCLWCNS